MKLIISFILLFPIQVSAQQYAAPIFHEVATSQSNVVRTISLCNNGTPTNSGINVTSQTSTGTIAGYFAVELYNPVSSTSTINCGFDTGVSTSIYTTSYGRELPPGAGVIYQVSQNNIPYCLTQNGTGCTQLTVTQFK